MNDSDVRRAARIVAHANANGLLDEPDRAAIIETFVPTWAICARQQWCDDELWFVAAATAQEATELVVKFYTAQFGLSDFAAWRVASRNSWTANKVPFYALAAGTMS